MKIVQKTYLTVEKEGRLVEIVVDQDMPLGLLFDALMEVKGYAVTRMKDAHKAEEAEAEKQMGTPEEVEVEVQEEQKAEE